MKKMNNKGFLLMETLVVIVFVSGTFTMIYNNVIPLIGEYNARFNYDDIDSVYAADILRSYMYDTMKVFNNTKTNPKEKYEYATNKEPGGICEHNESVFCNLTKYQYLDDDPIYYNAYDKTGFCNEKFMKESYYSNGCMNLLDSLNIKTVYISFWDNTDLKDNISAFDKYKQRGIYNYIYRLPSYNSLAYLKDEATSLTQDTFQRYYYGYRIIIEREVIENDVVKQKFANIEVIL